MKKQHLQLKKSEREYLETLLAKGQLRAKVFKRATALLELDRGKTLEAVATTLNVNRVSVMRWRDRYRRQAVPSLEEAPGSGRPIQIDGTQRAKITALACREAPPGYVLNLLDRAYPARRFDRIYVIADHYKIHQATAVEHWLRQHPRFQLLFLPTDCPRAHPMERCFGDLQDKVTRHHRRKRRHDLGRDVQQHLAPNGPWPDPLSELYDAAEVTQASVVSTK